MIKKFLLGIFFIFVLLIGNIAFADYYGPCWAKNSINVYIPQGNKYSVTAEHAFQKWERLIGGRLQFVFSDEEDADVVVNFVKDVDGTDGELGSYNTTIQGGKITKGEINMATEGDKKFSDSMIFTVMLHEIGHVLGLPDSNRKIGIMHSPVEENQDIIRNDIIRLYRFNNWPIITEVYGK